MATPCWTMPPCYWSKHCHLVQAKRYVWREPIRVTKLKSQTTPKSSGKIQSLVENSSMLKDPKSGSKLSYLSVHISWHYTWELTRNSVRHMASGWCEIKPWSLLLQDTWNGGCARSCYWAGIGYKQNCWSWVVRWGWPGTADECAATGLVCGNRGGCCIKIVGEFEIGPCCCWGCDTCMVGCTWLWRQFSMDVKTV
jgi:hypothetical protein